MTQLIYAEQFKALTSAPVFKNTEFTAERVINENKNNRTNDIISDVHNDDHINGGAIFATDKAITTACRYVNSSETNQQHQQLLEAQ